MDLGDTAQSQDNTTVLSWVLLPVRQGAGRNSGGGGGGGGQGPRASISLYWREMSHAGCFLRTS